MVSIIILSYNTEKILADCLSSIYTHVKEFPFEIIIVDNNSTDSSVDMIKRQFPKVKLLENKENVGFARGVNQAARAASGEYMLLLNSDTIMKDGTLKEMLDFIKEKSHDGIVGGRLENNDGSTSKSFGSFYNLWSVAKMLFRDRDGNTPALHTPKSVDWVSGGYMLIKRELFEDLKGFDEHFFMYMEDMEFCYRASLLKKKIWYYPQSVVTHIGQGSSNRSFAILQIYKGLLYFYKKHKTYLEYLSVMTLLLVKSILALCIGIITGNTYLLSTYRKAIRIVI